MVTTTVHYLMTNRIALNTRHTTKTWYVQIGNSNATACVCHWKWFATVRNIVWMAVMRAIKLAKTWKVHAKDFSVRINIVWLIKVGCAMVSMIVAITATKNTAVSNLSNWFWWRLNVCLLCLVNSMVMVSLAHLSTRFVHKFFPLRIYFLLRRSLFSKQLSTGKS